VGLSYGFAGDRGRELWWYTRAASNGFVEAYLAIGHVMRAEPISNEEQAAGWYQDYWNAGGQAKGYAAILLYRIEQGRGNAEQAEVWLLRCEETGYEGCSREQ